MVLKGNIFGIHKFNPILISCIRGKKKIVPLAYATKPPNRRVIAIRRAKRPVKPTHIDPAPAGGLPKPP